MISMRGQPMGWGPKKILQKWGYLWVIVAFGLLYIWMPKMDLVYLIVALFLVWVFGYVGGRSFLSRRV